MRRSHSWAIVACLAAAVWPAGCRATDPVSLLNGCLSAATRSGAGKPPAELRCSIERSIELVALPRAPVTESDLVTAGVPKQEATLLVGTGIQSPRLCTVQMSGGTAPPSSSTDATTQVGEAECEEISVEVERPLVARGRDFTFLFNRAEGQALLVGVKGS